MDNLTQKDVTRIEITSENVSRFNKRLKKALDEKGVTFKLTEVSELFAKACGLRNNHELTVLLNKIQPEMEHNFKEQAKDTNLLDDENLIAPPLFKSDKNLPKNFKISELIETGLFSGDSLWGDNAQKMRAFISSLKESRNYDVSSCYISMLNNSIAFNLTFKDGGEEYHTYLDLMTFEWFEGNSSNVSNPQGFSFSCANVKRYAKSEMEKICEDLGHENFLKMIMRVFALTDLKFYKVQRLHKLVAMNYSSLNTDPWIELSSTFDDTVKNTLKNLIDCDLIVYAGKLFGKKTIIPIVVMHKKVDVNVRACKGFVFSENSSKNPRYANPRGIYEKVDILLNMETEKAMNHFNDVLNPARLTCVSPEIKNGADVGYDVAIEMFKFLATFSPQEYGLNPSNAYKGFYVNSRSEGKEDAIVLKIYDQEVVVPVRNSIKIEFPNPKNLNDKKIFDLIRDKVSISWTDLRFKVGKLKDIKKEFLKTVKKVLEVDASFINEPYEALYANGEIRHFRFFEDVEKIIENELITNLAFKERKNSLKIITQKTTNFPGLVIKRNGNAFEISCFDKEKNSVYREMVTSVEDLPIAKAKVDKVRFEVAHLSGASQFSSKYYSSF